MREMTVAMAFGAAPLFALLLRRGRHGRAWTRSIGLLFAPLLVSLVCILTWNMVRVGEPILTTGAQFALMLAIAGAQLDGPDIFTHDTVLDEAARKQGSKKWDFYEAFQVNSALFNHGMQGPQIARLATERYVQAWLEHPLAMFRYFTKNAEEADALLVSRHVRSALDPRTEARYLDLAQRLFTLGMVVLPLAWIALAVILRPARPYFLLVGSLAIFSYINIFSYAPIHLEQRYLLPVIPAALLILSISIGAALQLVRWINVSVARAPCV
jgi:hypothetical protein